MPPLIHAQLWLGVPERSLERSTFTKPSDRNATELYYSWVMGKKISREEEMTKTEPGKEGRWRKIPLKSHT